MVIMDLIDSLARWNLWGRWHLPVSFPRENTREICRYLDTPEIIALIGPRRAGKSTILYQIMSHLLDKGVEQKSILHVNFEEPALSPYLKLELLDQLYDVYRAKVFPKGLAYIFLDEIQNVPGWERWIRARNDTEDIKIFITGSSSALLSGELATALTGRNFCFNIFPLNFKEVLNFKNIECPDLTVTTTPLPEIEYELHQYLQWGGFPRVVLAKDDDEREQILKRYFDEILFKDIVQRYNIRNEMALRNIAIHLLTNTSTLFTFKRLAAIFEVSQDLALSYTRYLKEAFLLSTLDFYSLKSSERMRNPMKVHAIDLGLRRIASLSNSEDETKLIETQVHNQIQRQGHDGLFYWKGVGEVDILTQDSNTVSGLYQVAFAGLTDQKVLQREFGALKEAGKQFKDADQQLITWAVDSKLNKNDYPDVAIKPLWQFLLEE